MKPAHGGRRVRTRALRIAAILTTVAAWFLVGCAHSERGEVVDGVLDLRGWSGDGVVVPAGDYRVEWDTTESRVGPPSADRLRVPGNVGRHWPSRGLFGALEGAGCAVVGFDVRMPVSGVPLAFAFEGLHARVRASALDGPPQVTEVETAPVSCDPTRNVELQFWQVVPLPRSEAVRVEIAVSPQVWGRSNLDGRFGIGTAGAVAGARTRAVLPRFGSVGVLLGLVAAAAVRSFKRHGSKGAVELAFFVGILALRQLSALRLVEPLVPHAWVYTVTLSAEYAAMPAGVAAGVAFFDATVGLPRSACAWVYRISTVLIAAILIAPQAYMSGPVVDVCKAYTVGASVWFLGYVFTRRGVAEGAETVMLRVGIVALVAGAAAGIFRNIYAPQLPELFPLATVIFALSQTALLTIRYGAALHAAETLVEKVDSANRELRETGDLVANFLTAASKELIEPSAAVLALAEGTAAAHGRRLGEELRHTFKLISDNARRVTVLAGELGDLGRTDDREVPSGRSATDGVLVVRRAVETARPLVLQHLLEVRVHVDSRVRWLGVDAAAFERAVASLLAFAVTYAEGGTLSVVVEPEGVLVCVTVSANGRFPNPGPLTSPFETVRRLARLGTPATRLGVGLTTARATATRCGGSLSLRVEREVGMIARLCVPAVEDGEAIASVRAPMSSRVVFETPRVPEARPSPGGRPVLVVEHDETTRTLMRRALEVRGYDVWLAADGESAIDTIVSAGPPDVVLLAGALPGLSAHHVLDALRERYDRATLPVLLLESSRSDEIVAEGFRRGASDWLQKPVLLGELEARIAHHLVLLDEFRAAASELAMRRRYEGEIERVAKLAGEAERSFRALDEAASRRSEPPLSEPRVDEAGERSGG